MFCLAVRSAFGFQVHNFVREDRKALVPDVIMLIVVVYIIIGHGLRRPAFYNIGRSRNFVGVKVRHCVSVMTLAFGRSYKLQGGFV